MRVPFEGEPVRLDGEAPFTFETRRTGVSLAAKEAERRLASAARQERTW